MFKIISNLDRPVEKEEITAGATIHREWWVVVLLIIGSGGTCSVNHFDGSLRAEVIRNRNPPLYHVHLYSLCREQ